MAGGPYALTVTQPETLPLLTLDGQVTATPMPLGGGGGGGPTVVAKLLNVEVPAFGTVNVGPFAYVDGSVLDAVVLPLDLGGGQKGSWGEASGGLGWRWYNNLDPEGSVSLRLESQAGTFHVNIFVLLYGP